MALGRVSRRAEDAPSAAALRLQQLNRLAELETGLEERSARLKGHAHAHELSDKTLAEQDAQIRPREARRDADRAVADANRALSRAEADRNLAQGALESLGWL